MAPLIRNLKNAMYTSTEAEVRNATSNEPCNTPIQELANIASNTFSPTLFPKIMNILETRLNDKGKSWRHVLKSLQVLEYCLIHGSEATAQWCKTNIHYIRTLKQFDHTEDGLDVGANVRAAATTLTTLINDSEMLRSERQKQGNWKSRLPNIRDPSPDRSSSTRGQPKSRRNEDEDMQVKLAIQASLNQAKEEEEKRRIASSHDDDLAKALKLSREEEEYRRRQQPEASEMTDTLINLNPTPAPAVMPQATGWNQGYMQQGAVDWFGNPVDPSQQQPMSTGYANPMPQTMFQTGYMFATPTGVLQPNTMQMTGYMPQQQTFGTGNPYSHQQPGPSLGADHTALAPQLPGTNNPWAAPAPQNPQPTGSNNPFAPRSQNASMSTLLSQQTNPNLHYGLMAPKSSSAPNGRTGQDQPNLIDI